VAKLFTLSVITLLTIIAAPILLEIIRADTGYILISIGHHTLEMSFWVGVILVFGLLLMSFVIVKLVLMLLRTFGVSVNFFRSAKSRQYNKRTQRGLIHYIEGNWRAAKADLLSVVKQSEQPLVHYLAAAHAAHQLGDADESQRLLALAEEKAPENELAVLLSQAKMQLSDKKYEQSLASLERARSKAPNHPVVLDLLRQNYLQLQDWPALIELLPALKKHWSKEAFAALQVEVYQAHLKAIYLQAKPEDKVTAMTTSWSEVPRALRESTEVLHTYGGILLQLNEHEQLEALLRRALRKHWDKKLVALYGLAEPGNYTEQLVVAEQWLRERAGDAELLLALARIAMRNRLWGKARNYFESSLQLHEQPQAYAELAGLLAHLGEHQNSTALYQKGLLLTTKNNTSAL